MIICPVCSEHMTKLKNGSLCKLCSTPLVKVITVDESGNEFETYEVRDKSGAAEKTIKQRTEGNFTIELDEENKTGMVTIKNTLVGGYIYCPNCNKKLFKNMTLRGRCEHKCDRCKYMVYHIFV